MVSHDNLAFPSPNASPLLIVMANWGRGWFLDMQHAACPHYISDVAQLPPTRHRHIKRALYDQVDHGFRTESIFYSFLPLFPFIKSYPKNLLIHQFKTPK